MYFVILHHIVPTENFHIQTFIGLYMDAHAWAQRNFERLILHKGQLVRSATLCRFQEIALCSNMYAHLIKRLKSKIHNFSWFLHLECMQWYARSAQCVYVLELKNWELIVIYFIVHIFKLIRCKCLNLYLQKNTSSVTVTCITKELSNYASIFFK